MILTRWFDDSIFPRLAVDLLRSFDNDFVPFDRRTGSLWSQDPSLASTRVHAYETDAEWVVSAEVPGMKESDLEITVHEGTVAIRGEREIALPDGYAPRIQERAPVKFAYRLTLPKNLDMDQARARVEDGILTLQFPKAPAAQPRQIPVTTP